MTNSKEREVNILIKIGVIAAFSTLAFIGTIVLRIPIPATGGYFNLGDTFVMISALLFGPVVGLAVGIIGPACADAIGFPQFILATGIVKGIEGLIVGLLGYKKESYPLPILGLIVGALTIVIGYYIFEASIYPSFAKSVPFFGVTDPKAAIAEIVPNLLQGFFSAIIAFGIFKAYKSIKK